MAAADERTLLLRSLGGDGQAFGQLICVHQRALFNVALRMLGNTEDARDVTQTAFVKAYRNLGTFDRRYRFFSWVYRILINEAMNLLKRRRPTEQIDAQLVSSEPSPEDRCHQNEVTEIVRSALMELSVDYRQVVVLRHLLSLSHRDISEAIGVPEKTVKSRLYTARQMLGDILERRGIGPT